MKRNDVYDFYELRLRKLKVDTVFLRKRETMLSYGRLTAFIMAVLGFGLLFSYSWMLAVAVMVVFLVIFGGLVKYQNRITHERELNEYRIRINEMEQFCLQGTFQNFPDGSEYIESNHRYSYDLDIFGRNSLFQMINRTTSKPAADMLSGWFKNPADVDVINQRQEAVIDLKDKVDWRQNIMAVGYHYKDAGNNPDEILNWVNTPGSFLSRRHLRPVIVSLSIVTIVVTIAVFAGVSAFFLLFTLIVNFFINYYFAKTVSRLHLQVSKSNDMLSSYSEVISMIEREKFTSRKLLSLQSSFKGVQSASEQVKKLSRLVHKLDNRLNILVSVVLNLFFFWDVHVCYRLEGWKQKNSGYIDRWFSAMAEIEVLSSFANLHFNNSEWAMPEVGEGPFHLDAVNAGHPLISADQRICNDFSIDGPGKIYLITGSNMSGKSTFLRTIGVNIVLAFSGSPVCADAFSLSRVKMLTSMRVSDSLEDNTSTFYAELKRLAMIIREAETGGRVFLLLDEMLHGTNSYDRHAGSVALIKQLIKYQATGMVATHDLELSDLEQELKGKLENYNFDVKINGEELYFDYKLNQGVCQSMNASLLMKKMGIEL